MKKNIKRWIFCGLMTFLMLFSWCFGNSVQASVQSDFINRLTPDVIKVAHQYNLYPSVMMAQAALESDFGQSSLSQDANNYFGIKGDYNGQSVLMPTMEYNQDGQPYYINSAFKKYPNVEASMADNAQLIRDGVYGNPSIYSGAWRENAADDITAANALGGKYATDPSYASNLTNLIQQYNLGSLLDNAWKRLHIKQLKQRAAKYLKRVRLDRRRAEASRRKTNHRERVASYRSQLIKYVKLYKNDQVALNRNYARYSIYDHLSRMDADNWQRVGAHLNQPIYVDLMGIKNQHQYYRIRFSPSQTHKYWVQSGALTFATPVYYSHSYRINAQQLNLSHAYNYILGTKHVIKAVPSQFTRNSYQSNRFAIVPQRYSGRVWYQIKNRSGHSVWVAASSSRPTQYLSYHQQKHLATRYSRAGLYDHAADQAYQNKRYSWSQVKPRHHQVTIDRLAIATHENNAFWYRINNQHRTYWTNESAFR